MKDLEKIIDTLTKDEIRFYKLFINRTSSSKNKSRKDEELFNFLKKGKHKDYSTKEILKKLSISNSNNYYQLKNRIYNDLNNSLTWQHISKDKQSSSFSYILLARVFKNRAELQLSFNYLLKAEKIAINEELYELLSIIYKLCFFEYLYTLGKNFFKSSNPFQFSITTANFIKVENLFDTRPIHVSLRN